MKPIQKKNKQTNKQTKQQNSLDRIELNVPSGFENVENVIKSATVKLDAGKKRRKEELSKIKRGINTFLLYIYINFFFLEKKYDDYYCLFKRRG